MGAYAEMKDKATIDLALSALGMALEAHGDTMLAEFNAWVANGRCRDPWHIEIYYIIISKKGKLSADHHRIIALERASGKIFFKILERRLRRVFEETGILGSNHVAFGTERSHVEVLIGIRSLLDANPRDQQCFLATHDWPQAYDYMSWGLLTAIGERLLGAGRFFGLVCALFREAPRSLFAGPGDGIGPVRGATNGGAQGNCLLPLAWNLYCAPLVKAATLRYNAVRGSTYGFCDDAVAYRRSVEAVEDFFNLCDTFVVATGSPLGTKHAVACNHEARKRLGPHTIFVRRMHGPAIVVQGAIVYLGQCAHLDKTRPCASRTCTSCFKGATSSVCDTCIENMVVNLQYSKLSPMNRATVAKMYVLNPLVQQLWLCEAAWGKYLARCSGAPAGLGVPARTSVRVALHGNVISGPYTEALELDVRLGGAGLGEPEEYAAKQIITDFIRSSYGPAEPARVILGLWDDPGRGKKNKVVTRALKVFEAALIMRPYPSDQFVRTWQQAHRREPQLHGKSAVVTWVRKINDKFYQLCAAELATILSTGGPWSAKSEIMETTDEDEAQLAAIWAALRLGLREDRFFIATTATAAMRVKKFRRTTPRRRLRLAYGLWLQPAAQTLMEVVSIEECGMPITWLQSLGGPDRTGASGEDPVPLVTLSGPDIGVRHDRFLKFIKAACRKRELGRLWGRLARTGAGVETRVPRALGSSSKTIAWTQSAKVGFTGQTKLACTSPLSPGETHALLNWRFGGIIKSGLMATTQCRGCGMRPYNLLHVIDSPEFRATQAEAVQKLAPALEAWGCPRWWEPGEWIVQGHGLMCALGYVPQEVQIQIDECGYDKAERTAREEGVLDLQLQLVRAFLRATLEHPPDDARTDLSQRGDRHPRLRERGTEESPFQQRKKRRAVKRPDIEETRDQYKIKERTWVMFDGAARKTESASAVVIMDTSTGEFVRLAYKHPRYRVAAVGEKLGFILSRLLLGRMWAEWPLEARRTVAYVGDNETLMQQFTRTVGNQYRCTTEVSRRTRDWLREHIPSQHGSYFVHREHNWRPDAVGNEVLDGGNDLLFSQGITSDMAHGLIRECEEVWSAIENARPNVGIAPVGVGDEDESTDRTRDSSASDSSDEDIGNWTEYSYDLR